ncbi:MAG TPA: malto-oligosyltrehalose synthase [Gammaproteobacteria bacterium]|nr:malto-oligosyltrehalose synthase [Gammaproteobacteria bacterium]
MTAPLATYRLQFHRDFRFADAERIVPYLADLGVSHLYASPWLMARAGSRHGYDITDHNAFNPEIGTAEDFERLSALLRRHRLGHILDFVPNHMGIGDDNAWWLDVLEWGRASPFAACFDIDWSGTEPGLRNKLLLPFLGDHYGRVLECGELELVFDAEQGSFAVRYFEHRFPLAPRSYANVLRAAHTTLPAALAALAGEFAALRLRAGGASGRAAETRQRAAERKRQLADLARRDSEARAAIAQAVATFGGQAGDARSFRPLHRLLEAQFYRLAYWRAASDDINYRRFFDNNDLAALRIEDPQLFATAHRLVAQLLADGRLDGLRIDHIDGLHDPAEYCRRLRELVQRPFFVVVEKILAHHEALRAWPVAGTTGYDFLADVTALLVASASEAAMSRTYRRFLGRDPDFGDIVYRAKREIMETRLAGELHGLARDLKRIAAADWNARDYSRESLERALEEVVACFPVYRSYVDGRGADEIDCRYIDWAVAQARQRSREPDGSIFDFIRAALTAELAPVPGARRRAVLRFAMRFQQYTAPVMAKGFEDTAFYRYHRLICLNDVGENPLRFGLSVAAFHHANAERARLHPHGLLATATHDSKRGEDVRARLAVLAAMPAAWDRQVRRWAHLNRRKKRGVRDRAAPDRNDEYFLYQTLVGAWPAELLGEDSDEATVGDFLARVQACFVKSIREAKLHSSWIDPDVAYEEAASDFVARILDPERNRPFFDDCRSFARELAALGVDASLVQLVLKLTSPGVPDMYQGGELWDLNLVDPDNRRSVDFGLRERRLREIGEVARLAAEQRIAALRKLRAHWEDGKIKLFVLHALLDFRRRHPELFSDGSYVPLAVEGPQAARICAFERSCGDDAIVVAVAVPAGEHGGDWTETVVELAGEKRGAWQELLSGRSFSGSQFRAATLFANLPIAVLASARGHS